MTKVFVSSTCYDLIDLRAEIKDLIQGLGLSPVMSDQKDSAFDTPNDVSSIETCLVNVRNSDITVFVFSQRYGPSIKDFGYPDVSATELEYDEAQKATKPCFVYVRDRLMAETAIWSRTEEADRGALHLPWVRKDTRLCALVERHKKPTNPRNWLWEFTTSVDLKERLAYDLRREAPDGILADLRRRKQVALVRAVVTFEFSDPNNIQTYQVVFHNLGDVPALQFQVIHVSNWTPPGGMGNNPYIMMPDRHSGGAKFYMRPSEKRAAARVQFDALDGTRVEQEYEFDSDSQRVRLVKEKIAAGEHAP